MKKKENPMIGCLSALNNQFFIIFSVVLPAAVFISDFHSFLNEEILTIVIFILFLIDWGLTVKLEFAIFPYIIGAICWSVSLLATFFFTTTINYKLFAVILFIIWSLMGLVYYFSIKDFYK